jgi:hypothetical protein
MLHAIMFRNRSAIMKHDRVASMLAEVNKLPALVAVAAAVLIPACIWRVAR